MTRFISLPLLIVLFSQVSIWFPVYSGDPTGELYQYLLSNYNKHVRPVKNNSDIVNVKLGLKLIQIADVVCDYI
jgi:hypothetical protein